MTKAEQISFSVVVAVSGLRRLCICNSNLDINFLTDSRNPHVGFEKEGQGIPYSI